VVTKKEKMSEDCCGKHSQRSLGNGVFTKHLKVQFVDLNL
jgi:hypothetical protein